MLSQEIFDQETSMCSDLHEKQGGCNWWRCENCGVIPLLHKLKSEEIIETPEEVQALKERYLKKWLR